MVSLATEPVEYKGAALSFGLGSHAYLGINFNDRATSIAIPAGCGLVAEVFENANYQGGSTVISYSQMSIGTDWSGLGSYRVDGIILHRLGVALR